MCKGERKRYSTEFKLSAVCLMLSKTKQSKETFQMLDVDWQTVYRRSSEFKPCGAAFDYYYNNLRPHSALGYIPLLAA